MFVTFNAALEVKGIIPKQAFANLLYTMHGGSTIEGMKQNLCVMAICASGFPDNLIWSHGVFLWHIALNRALHMGVAPDQIFNLYYMIWRTFKNTTWLWTHTGLRNCLCDGKDYLVLTNVCQRKKDIASLFESSFPPLRFYAAWYVLEIRL